MQKSLYFIVIISLSLSLSWIPHAHAEKDCDKEVVEVEEVTVTATRAEKEPFNTPNAITVLNLKQLERTNAEHASNLLRDAVGVSAQQTTVGQGSPLLRGLTGYQTLIQVDWVRLNNSTFRSGPNQYTATIGPEMLDRAEVLLGSSSMLYGSGAMGVSLVSLRKRSPSIQRSKPGISSHDSLLATRLPRRNGSVGWR